MNLQINNENAISFTEAVGISPERVLDLNDKLDALMKKMQGQRLQVCNIMDEIAEMCENKEELVYCTITHCNYMALSFKIYYCLPATFKELFEKKQG